MIDLFTTKSRAATAFVFALLIGMKLLKVTATKSFAAVGVHLLTG